MIKIIKILQLVFSRREKIQLFALLALIIIMSLSQAISVATVMPFIGLVLNPNLVLENQWLNWVFSALKFNSIYTFTIFVGLAMFVIIIFTNSVSAIATWLQVKFAWTYNHRISSYLLEKYLSMPYTYFLEKNSASLSNNVLSEVNKLTQMSLIPFFALITKALVVIFIISILFIIDLRISLIAIIIFGGTYIAIYIKVSNNLKNIGSQLLQANNMRFKIVGEAFGGIKMIKLMNRERYFIDKYSKESLKHADFESWNTVVAQIPRFALEAVAFGGIIIFVLVLLITREDTSRVIPIAGLFAFAGYRLMPALQEVFNALTNIKFNKAVLDRVYMDLLVSFNTEKAPVYYSGNNINPMPFNNTITLNNVTFFYPNYKKPVLNSINLCINCNSLVAFVGPTGGGKTTLVDIIIGLLTPHSGLIMIDQENLSNKNLVNWQCNIGYVPQNIYLTDDTIEKNIAFGIPDKKINHHSVKNAARMAKIDEFIEKELPSGYQTFIGEQGIRLSGGQRQRIGIARALYNNPAILVFDEATSSLDGVTEESVLEALKSTARYKTLIIIAHRLTTVKDCDIIYLIDQGNIVASGTYCDLLSSNYQFQQMAKANNKYY